MLKLIMSISVFLISFQSFAANDSIYIKVGEAKLKKSLIAIPAFQFVGSPAAAKNYNSVGIDLYKTIYNDLTVTSYFQFISTEAYLEDPQKVSMLPAPGDPKGFKFQNWSAIGAEFLVRAAYTMVGDQLTLETYSYFVPQAKLILGKKYKGTVSNLRRIAHTFANDLVKELTGQNGMFLSKVVVSSDRGGNNWKEIYIMDWDGSNIQKMSNHRSIAISPAWAPNGKSIAYTAYVFRAALKRPNPDLLIYDLDSGKRFLVSQHIGLNSGAFWFADNKNLLLTISQTGNPDIYKINRDGNILNRLTNGPTGAMNVEPAISPDGKRIAFSSDRSGQPMIYVMGIDASNVKRLTFAGKYNASPAWSPDGSKIAFAGWEASHFDIFVMDQDGGNMLRLTTARKGNGSFASNENPTWSPDGRHIMFISDRSGSKQIYIVNPDGTNERRITFDNFNYFQPRWSINLE